MAEVPPRLPITPRSSRTRRPAPDRSKFVRRRITALLLVLVLLVVIWFLGSLYQPGHGAGHGSRTVTIPRDSSISQVATILHNDGVVSSSFFFKLRVELAGDKDKLRAGVFKLPLDTSYANALRILTTVPPAAPTVTVTIIPGRSREQVNKLLVAEGTKGYLAHTRHSPLLDPTDYGAPKGTPSLEGFLFPNTYELKKPMRIGKLVEDQLQAFKQNFGTVNLSYAKSKNLTGYDVLTIASLIEGEARLPSDERKVASVIYNRLRDNMDLGMDSTVEYATGDYSGHLTERELGSPSPWNTRNHPGLPPTPIDSPGLDAIQAAAHPAQTNYLYFVNKVCGDGALAFTDSYSRFEQLSEAWASASQAAAQHGGSPEFCKKKGG